MASISQFSPEVRFLLTICCCILIFGGLGGVAGGLYRYKCNFFPCISRWRDFIIFFLSGSVCAFGVAILCSGICSIFDKNNTFSLGLYVVGLSLVSGFFSMRIIPHLGNKLEEEINAVNQRVTEAEKKREMATEYNKLISIATTTLATKNPTDVQYAISCISQDISSYRWDRTLNIYLGRLYRCQSDFDNAILTLRKFISEKHKNNTTESQVDKEALAAAYFNISCYHTLKINQCPQERKRLLNEAGEALKQAMNLSPNIRETALIDEDLTTFREERPDFFEKNE